jgi:hypothetical protein
MSIPVSVEGKVSIQYVGEIPFQEWALKRRKNKRGYGQSIVLLGQGHLRLLSVWVASERFVTIIGSSNNQELFHFFIGNSL